MLPLVAILAITAIKDAIEDSRRHSLDNEVNNSAVTRLGDWNNVNKAVDHRPWYQCWGSRAGKGVSRGVRKLREKEGDYDAGFLYTDTLEADAPYGGSPSLEEQMAKNDSTYTIEPPSSYPPGRPRALTIDSNDPSVSGHSHRSRKSSDVVSYDHSTPGTAKWERTLWKKLEVGDIVLLKENDQIPADIVVLASSDPEGVCFIETKNLDGETNLKPRKSLKATMGIGNEEDIEHARFWVDSEAPHANLYSYNGVLKYRSRGEQIGREHPVVEGREYESGREVQEPITISELLLRGCALRNTKWVIGLVLFTGADTKIMLNQGMCRSGVSGLRVLTFFTSGETPSKRSKIEKETNFNVLANFVILMGLCLGCAIGGAVFYSQTNNSSDYYEIGAAVSTSSALNGVVIFG